MAGIESIRGVIGFVRTVAAGSFAGAAKELGVSPVAVSKNVQRLERRLGVRLLQRSTRKLSLTEEGRLFHERCIGPLRELESAQSAVKDKGRSPAGKLRLTSISPFGRTYVLPLLPAFSRLYPEIEVELHLDDAISDMIAEGYDVGIRAGEMKNGTMIVREIAPLHFIVCGAPSYLARNGMPQKPADLASHNCLRLRSRPAPAKPLNWLLGPEQGAGFAANWRQLSCQRHHDAGDGGSARPRPGVCAAAVSTSLVSIECPGALTPGLDVETWPPIHSLSEPQALASACPELREFRARPLPEQSRPCFRIREGLIAPFVRSK